MEFKSIEFTGDHSIKTTYMAGDGNQDEYTVTCSDLPRPELRTTGLAILPGVLTMTLGDDAISCLKKGYQDWTPAVVLRKLSIRVAKKNAQGQLFTDSEAKEIVEAMGASKKEDKEDSDEELEELEKHAADRRKKVYKEVCKDCVNYIDKGKCGKCFNHNCFQGEQA